MSFPTYPAYKDSGVEWLGDVPEHWEVGSLRRLIKSVGNGTTADQVDEAEDTVAVSRIETISAGLINFEKVGHVGPQDVARRFLLNAGDILFSHINSLSMVGNVAIYSGGRPLLHGMNLLRIQPLPSIASEWLLYWLKSKNVRQEVESRAKPAINQASISTDSVRALPALIPPSFEQTQIARFLDHETARIDALIAEQQRLIELLKEKRQAVISHAVTKGLDPTVPMKDSGVEWLGEVPAHWEVTKLSFITSRIGSGKTPSGGADAYVADGVTFIRSQNVYDEELRLDDCVFIDEATDLEMAWSRVRPLDVLINITGASIGRTCIVPEDFGRANVNQHVCVIRLSSPKKNAAWVSEALKATPTKHQVDISQTGAAREGLNFEQLAGFWISVPPLGEMAPILAHIRQMRAVIGQLLNEAEASVNLLKERRSALISAAVTGKIDVRGWQPTASIQVPEPAVAEAN